MLLSRLYLRNYRVYEGELELTLPPGLVGVYGPNGSGKSTLLEAITWTLFGRARTGKDEVRSAGVGGDCVTELEFEHEGHLYVVRRRLTGVACTIKAEVFCDGFGMAEGIADTRRYVQSVLGMDDGAFRASVFAEQKQLAAFSSQAPADRRRLVLQLLGITPLDGAKDAARKDAREKETVRTQLLAALPDLEALAVGAADADAAAGALEAEAVAERGAAEARARAEADARAGWEHLDRARQAYDALCVEGRAARDALDREVEAVETLAKELDELGEAGLQLAEAEAAAAGLDDDRAHLAALRGALDARRRLDEATAALAPEPPALEPLAATATAAAQRSQSLAAERAAVDAVLRAAEADRERAVQLLDRSASLSEQADCPLCGQELGDAFAAVQAHRREELHEAEQRVAGLRSQALECSSAAAAAEADAAAAALAHREAAELRRRWDLDRAALAEAERAWHAASAPLDPFEREVAAPRLHQVARELSRTVDAKDDASKAVGRLRGRLDRRPLVEKDLQTARDRVESARTVVEGLRDQLRAVGFDPAALGAAAAALTAAVADHRAADERARSAELAAAAARSKADGEAKRLADGRAQHARLGDLEAEVRHLSRVAALLSDFRNTVVATVGPRLAAQAAELFGELTDREYDELTVDPETYGLQITDHGITYGLDRFSGSEVDLANLALRVAISEHVRFQSGGAVGLLVLDEVFGPLDEDRKARMLQALESLRGRFRQVLVVTHDGAIKEQLPNAVEVVKLAGRRATARLLA